MADAIQRQKRHGTAAQNDTFTGAARELSTDTTNQRLRLHDGILAGGRHIPNHTDIQSQAMNSGTVTGTNALVLTVAPVPTAYAIFQTFYIKIANNNTGAVTINVNSLGAKSIKKSNGADDLEIDDLVAGGVYEIVYDGTQFQLINTIVSASRPPVLLENASISSAASSIDLSTGFTDTQWDEIRVNILNLHTVSSAEIRGRISVSGAFKTGGTDYAWGRWRKHDVATAITSVGDTADTFAGLTHSHTTAVDQSFTGNIRIFKPTESTYFVTWLSEIICYNGAAISFNRSFGQFENAGVAAAIDGFRIYASTGDIDDATVTTHGIRYT